jgi:hypothetical protein
MGIGSMRCLVCTTSTRPFNPHVGMWIFETDTSTMRVYLLNEWSGPRLVS